MPIGAAIGGAVVGAGASIYSANKQSKAIKGAAQAQADATAQELEFQRQARDEARAQLQPYSDLGKQARDRYYGARGLTPSTAGYTTDQAATDYENSFLNSPDWQDAQYSTAQALGALRSTNAAMGKGSAINSGKALRAASDITQSYRAGARTGYDNALLGAIDLGVQGDSGIASGGQTFANNASSAVRNGAQQQGQYALAAAQAQANGMSNAAGFAGWGLNQFLNRPGTYGAQPVGVLSSPVLNTSAVNTGSIDYVRGVPYYGSYNG